MKHDKPIQTIVTLKNPKIIEILKGILESERQENNIKMSVSENIRKLNDVLSFKWYEKSIKDLEKEDGGAEFKAGFSNMLACEYFSKEEHRNKIGNVKIGDKMFKITISDLISRTTQDWKSNYSAEVYSYINAEPLGIKRMLSKFINGRFNTWKKLAVDIKNPESVKKERLDFNEQTEINFVLQYKRITNAESKGIISKSQALLLKDAINKVINCNNTFKTPQSKKLS